MRVYDQGLAALGADALPEVRVRVSRWDQITVFVGALASVATLWMAYRMTKRRS